MFNLGGFAAVLHGNRVWVGNSNGASTNCAEGVRHLRRRR
jgi:hypothetical protein